MVRFVWINAGQSEKKIASLSPSEMGWQCYFLAVGDESLLGAASELMRAAWATLDPRVSSSLQRSSPVSSLTLVLPRPL